MRLIDADALCRKLQAELGSPEGHKKLMHINYLITSAPTIEAEPVRRGGWREKWFGYGYIIRCSECGRVSDKMTDYCPNCGAKMEDADD